MKESCVLKFITCDFNLGLNIFCYDLIWSYLMERDGTHLIFLEHNLFYRIVSKVEYGYKSTFKT